MTRNEIVAQARTWLGTPWHHQGRLKGVGVDCIGLVIEVLKELGIQTEDTTDYSRFPDGKSLQEAMARHFVEADKPQPGDILLMRVTKMPQHVGFVTDKGVIHSYYGAGVVETGLGKNWKERVVAAYSVPGVE